MAAITFTIEKRIEGALGRAGRIETPHGSIETPAFVVVGTKANVKALTPQMVRETGAQIVLANTYHLYLEPGDEIVRAAGDLHTFMRWNGPMMTDSGGFQVYSLGIAYGRDHSKFLSQHDVKTFLENPPQRESRARLAKVSEEGVRFTSHLDGSTHFFTPEKSIAVQHHLGADIMFAFDDFVTPTDPYDDHRRATERTHRWAERCIAAHKEDTTAVSKQALFGIVQGGPFEDLRTASARTIGSMDFDGYGIGGSYTKEEMEKTLTWVNPLLPEEKPRHLLGIGEPIQLFIAVEHGIDTFDCVAPTREARNGRLYTRSGRINIGNARFKKDFAPIDSACSCTTCAGGFTRAYIAHLFRASELLGYTLASIHNIHFFTGLLKGMRVSILEDSFSAYKGKFIERYAPQE
jgi:queuine tRNA-ribosyltransferase